MTKHYTPVHRDDWQTLNLQLESIFYELKKMKSANSSQLPSPKTEIETASQAKTVEVIGVDNDETGIDIYSPKEGETADVGVPDTGHLHRTLGGQAIPSSYFLDLRGSRPSTTTWTITADWIVLHDNSTPWKTIGLSSINETNTVTTAGPIAGGRDQSGTFIDGWIHFFIIYNPITNDVSSLSSTSATSPTLPTGYTYFARVSSSYWTAGTSTITSGRQVSEKIWLDDSYEFTHIGVSSYHDLDISLAIPATAKSVQGGFCPIETVAANRDAWIASAYGICPVSNRFHTAGAASYRKMYFDLPIVVSQTLTFYTESAAEQWMVEIYSYTDDL